MIQQRIFSALGTTTAFALVLFGTFSCMAGVATSAPESKSNADKEKDQGKTPPADVGTLAEQVKELQKQVAELRALQSPRIVAAGTASCQTDTNNRTHARVKLSPEVTARLGKDCIVQLTNRHPPGGVIFFAPTWKLAPNGFDITLILSDVNDGTDPAGERLPNKTFLIDWIVISDPSLAARSGRQGGGADAEVLVTVFVPANATVWVSGDKSTQTGSRREFTSSGLTPGKTYIYTIRARWKEGEKVEDQTQKVSVKAGERRSIDFSALPKKPVPGPDGGD